MRFITTGMMSAMLACTGGAILLVQAADRAGMSDHELLSWFFAVYVAGGVLNTLLTLKYKMPFAGVHSITEIAYIGSVAAHYTLPELAGGFILSGVIMTVAGSTGIFGRPQIFPAPFIALMTGIPLLGLFIRSVKSVVQLRQHIVPSIVTFILAASRLNLFGISAPLWALLAGVVLLYVRQKFANRKGGMQDEV